MGLPRYAPVARVKYGCGGAAMQGPLRRRRMPSRRQRIMYRVKPDFAITDEQPSVLMSTAMFARGITLLELLVVLVARRHRRRARAARLSPALAARASHRSHDRACCELQSAEETYYLRHDVYAATSRPRRRPVSGSRRPAVQTNTVFGIAVASDGQSFIATATPTPGGGQAADRECLAFSIDARGRRAVSGTRDTRLLLEVTCAIVARMR